MSNDRPGGQGGLFPGIGGQYGAGAGMGQLSPYLNIDPSYLSQSQPEYLMNEETKRGALEKSFSAIGTSVVVGSAIGGTFGFFDGKNSLSLGSLKVHYAMISKNLHKTIATLL